MTAAQDRLNQILPSWYNLLTQWSLDGSLVAAATDALMLESSNAKQDAKGQLQAYASQWSAGHFQNLPQIVLLSAADISGVYGAYADSTNTIYLNQDWLLGASAEEIQKVLTHELGHYLDDQLNSVDTHGDEGEKLSRLLFKEKLGIEATEVSPNGSDTVWISDGTTSIRAEAAAAQPTYISVSPVVGGQSLSIQPTFVETLSDGKTLVAWKSLDNIAQFTGLTRLLSNGTVDTSFGTQGHVSIGSGVIGFVDTISNGSILVGTHFANYNNTGSSAQALLALNNTGAVIGQAAANIGPWNIVTSGHYNPSTNTVSLIGFSDDAAQYTIDLSVTQWSIDPLTSTLNPSYQSEILFDAGRDEYPESDPIIDSSGTVYIGGVKQDYLNNYFGVPIVCSYNSQSSANQTFSSGGISFPDGEFGSNYSCVSSLTFSPSNTIYSVILSLSDRSRFSVVETGKDGRQIGIKKYSFPAGLAAKNELVGSNIIAYSGGYVFSYLATLPDSTTDLVIVGLDPQGSLDPLFGNQGYLQISLPGTQEVWFSGHDCNITADSAGNLLCPIYDSTTGTTGIITLRISDYVQAPTRLIGDGNVNLDLIGTAADDRMSGKGVPTTGGQDIIDGKGGTNDVVFESGNYNFKISGTSTASTIVGSTTAKVGSKTVTTIYINDSIANVEGIEITGGASANTLDASAYSGRANLNGDAGADTIIGGTGADVLTGGLGADIFRFAVKPTSLTAATADRITDFKSAESDKIQVARSVFGISSTAKVSLTTTADINKGLATSSLFVLDSTTGYLYYNANGLTADAGTSGGIFAVLDKIGSAVPTLTASNIALV